MILPIFEFTMSEIINYRDDDGVYCSSKPAQVSHIETIVKIQRDVYGNVAGPIIKDIIKQKLSRILYKPEPDEGGNLFIDHVIGYVLVSKSPNGDLMIRDIVVVEGYRKYGFGGFMIDDVVHFQKEKTENPLKIGVLSPKGLGAFWESAGMEFQEEKDNQELYIKIV